MDEGLPENRKYDVDIALLAAWRTYPKNWDSEKPLISLLHFRCVK